MYYIEKYIHELSRRCFLLILSCFLTGGFLYIWSFEFCIFLGQMIDIPYDDQTLHHFIFTDITEAFQAFLGMSCITTCCLQIPYILYTFWSFLVPSLYQYERKILTYTLLVFLVVYSIAISVTLWYVFPKVFEFFFTFQFSHSQISLDCELKISSFISFFWKTFAVTQTICQMPFWISLALYFHVLDLPFFLNSRKVFYIIILLFSALMAPPHVLVQLYVSLCLLCVFEVTLLIMIMVHIYSHYVHN